MTREQAQELIEKHAAQLSEHFSSIQIVGTVLLPDGGTGWHAAGMGDWYARKAACQEFVERDQAQTVARTIKEVEDEP